MFYVQVRCPSQHLDWRGSGWITVGVGADRAAAARAGANAYERLPCPCPKARSGQFHHPDQIRVISEADAERADPQAPLLAAYDLARMSALEAL